MKGRLHACETLVAGHSPGGCCAQQVQLQCLMAAEWELSIALWWQLMGVKEKEEAALARSGVQAEPAGAPVCWSLCMDFESHARLSVTDPLSSSLPLLMAAKECLSWPACRDPPIRFNVLGKHTKEMLGYRCAGDGSGRFRWWYGLLASLAAALLLAALLAGMMVWWRRRRRLRDAEATKLAVVERVRGHCLPRVVELSVRSRGQRAAAKCYCCGGTVLGCLPVCLELAMPSCRGSKVGNFSCD